MSPCGRASARRAPAGGVRALLGAAGCRFFAAGAARRLGSRPATPCASGRPKSATATRRRARARRRRRRGHDRCGAPGSDQRVTCRTHDSTARSSLRARVRVSCYWRIHSQVLRRPSLERRLGRQPSSRSASAGSRTLRRISPARGSAIVGSPRRRRSRGGTVACSSATVVATPVATLKTPPAGPIAASIAVRRRRRRRSPASARRRRRSLVAWPPPSARGRSRRRRPRGSALPRPVDVPEAAGRRGPSRRAGSSRRGTPRPRASTIPYGASGSRGSSSRAGRGHSP